jgi:hypothetical protein
MGRFVGVGVGVVVAVLVLGVAGCGSAGDPVLRVGSSSVSRAMLGHWMGVIVAGDYRDEIGKPAPVGLVSDPPDYGRCVAAASKIGPRKPPAVVGELCRELYQAVKLQAVDFLADALWHIEDAKEHHQAVSTQEIQHRYRILKARELAAPGQFNRYLQEVHRTLADEYYLFERNILTDRLLQRIHQQAEKQGGGEQVLLKLVEEWTAKWTSRTSCQPNYIASQCKQYKKPTNNPPAANHILLQLTGQA